MIPSDLFHAYEAALHGNVELMQKAFAQLMNEVETMEPMAARKYIRQAYQAIVARHGSYASVAALEFYETNRAQSALKTRYDATAFVPDNAALLEYDVTDAMSASADVQKIVDRLFGNGIERVMQYADETILENARHDPARPLWALVPHAGACGWCRLISSRGYDYVSKEKVENTRHPNCKCSPVVDFDTKNPRLDGYEPSKLEDEYKDARKSVESQARQQWDEMSQEERDQYEVKGRSAYDHFLRNKIVYAMDDINK